MLVGDSYQIASIRFGNWFNVAHKFVPATSVFELTTPYRSNNPNLLLLWERVRKMDDRVEETIVICVEIIVRIAPQKSKGADHIRFSIAEILWFLVHSIAIC